MTIEELRTAVEQQAALMVAVATGGPQINSKQEEYIKRRDSIASELKRLGLDDPNSYRDLWAWYGYYSQNLGRWHERRTYIRELYEPLHKALDAIGEREIGTGIQPERTGWEKVDDQVVQLGQRYSAAQTVEDFQAVGLLSRDVFVSLGEACYDPAKHAGDGKDAPEELTDKLIAVVGVEAAGASNKELRKLLKANIDYANKVQHDRAGTREHARIVAESTVTTVRLMRTLILGAQPSEEGAGGPSADDDIPF